MDEEETVRGTPFFAQEGNEIVQIDRLSGGLQNSNFKVTTASGDRFVVRIPATDAAEHGQDQAVVYQNALAAAAAQIAPLPVAFDKQTGVIVTEWIEGTTLTPAVVKTDPEMLSKFVGVVRKLHRADLQLVKSQASDVISGYPIEGLADLLPSGAVPPRAVELQRLLRRCEGAFEPAVGCHNDLTPANCIVSDDGAASLIDWEWSGPCDVMHDIAKLALLSEMNTEDEKKVLRLYFGPEFEAKMPFYIARMRLWHLHTMSREALWCHAKSNNPADDDYDYVGEAKKIAQEFVEKLEKEETTSFMAEVEAALTRN